MAVSNMTQATGLAVHHELYQTIPAWFVAAACSIESATVHRSLELPIQLTFRFLHTTVVARQGALMSLPLTSHNHTEQTT